MKGQRISKTRQNRSAYQYPNYFSKCKDRNELDGKERGHLLDVVRVLDRRGPSEDPDKPGFAIFQTAGKECHFRCRRCGHEEVSSWRLKA